MNFVDTSEIWLKLFSFDVGQNSKHVGTIVADMLMEQDDFCLHYVNNMQPVAATNLNNARAPGSVLTEECKLVDSYKTIPHIQFD